MHRKISYFCWAFILPWTLAACGDEETIEPACESGQTQEVDCGNNGTRVDLCVLNQWVEGECIVDTSECENGEESTTENSCGINGRGTKHLQCQQGSWVEQSCEDPDACKDTLVNTESCEEDESLSREQVCQNGQWSDWGECGESHACNPEDEPQYQSCDGINGNAEQARSCIDGAWSDWGDCEDPDECLAETSEEVVCHINQKDGGHNGEATATQTCELSSQNNWKWTVGECIDPHECTNDTTRSQNCVAGEPGTQTSTCENGQWGDWGECDPNALCENEATQTRVGCGWNGNGTETTTCEDGQWSDWGDCNDPDVCKNKAVIPQECEINGAVGGFNGKATRERTCQGGQWGTWSDCYDPDICENGEEENEVCGFNDSGNITRICEDGQWNDWSECDSTHVCENDDEETDTCGFNDSGNIARTCEDGQWNDWSECDSTHVCENDDEETDTCGINGNGLIARTCKEGQWNEWSDCNDPDECEPTDFEIDACENAPSQGLVDAVANQNLEYGRFGSRERLCELQTDETWAWSDWSKCEATQLAISASSAEQDTHACAIHWDGRLVCWGNNSHGQLGIGNTTDQMSPVFVDEALPEVAHVAAGRNFTCAVTRDGDLYCWGAGQHGVLGNGSEDDQSIPTKATTDDGLKFVQVEAGIAHACARTSETSGSKLYCWGANGDGQVGVGDRNKRTIPTEVQVTEEVVNIVAHRYTTCLQAAPPQTFPVLRGHLSACWGLNTSNRAGIEGSTASFTTPQLVGPNNLNQLLTHIALAGKTICARNQQGAVACMGGGNDVILNTDGNTHRPDFEPIGLQLPGADRNVVLKGGNGPSDKGNMCSLDLASNDLELKCWGSNVSQSITPSSDTTQHPEKYLRLAVKDNAIRTTPLAALEFAVGTTSICAIDESGTVYCSGQWGYHAPNMEHHDGRAAPLLDLPEP